MVGILLLDWAWAWGGGPGSPPGFPSKLVVPELDVVRRVVARAGAAQAAEVLAGWVVGGDGARRPVAGAIGLAHRAHQLGGRPRHGGVAPLDPLGVVAGRLHERAALGPANVAELVQLERVLDVLVDGARVVKDAAGHALRGVDLAAPPKVD